MRTSWCKSLASGLRRLLILQMMLCCMPAIAGRAQYIIDAPPAWVTPMPLTENASSPSDSDGSTEYLLVDHQMRIDRGSVDYSRFVVRLLNQSGVDDESQITIEFDPVKDQVHLHRVTIRRSGTAIDALARAKTQVLQRERGLESGVLDGSLTLHLLLDDVRVGDVLDYSYSIRHREPEWGNKTFRRITTGWSSPVRRSHLRVQSRREMPLQLRNHDKLMPARFQEGEWVSLEWNWHDLPGTQSEDHRPSWYELFPSVELSEFPNWAAVAAAAQLLYDLPATADPALNHLVAQLRVGADTQEARALAALRFVQEQIRYTGIELGQGAYRPNPPAIVLARRYGDCKDKALLTVALMRQLGIEAVPALVSTHWLHEVNQQLASPGAMNHVIVRARIRGKTYWLDATDTGQGGTLETTTRANEGFALPVAPDTVSLEPIPMQPMPHPMMDSRVEIDLQKRIEAGTLSVRTQYRGPQADQMRRDLRTQTLKELGENYFKFYQKRYSHLRQLALPTVHDDLLANELLVVESYQLTNPFEPSRDGRPTLQIDTDEMTSHVKAPDSINRTTPITVSFPIDIRETIRVHLPRPWGIDPDDQKIEDPAFRYESHVAENGSTVRLEYRYQSLVDHVSPQQLQRYDAQLQKVREDMGYQLYSTAPRAAQSTGAHTQPHEKRSSGWILWLGSVWAGLWLVRRLAGMRSFLTSAIQAASASPADAESLEPAERRVLESRDEELRASGFSCMGYLACTPLLSYYKEREHYRIYRHEQEPITAIVQRRLAVESGLYTHLTFDSERADGVRLSTASQQVAENFDLREVQPESAPNLSTAAQLARHRERLAGQEGLAPPPADLQAFAEQIQAMLAAHRTHLRKLGWCVPSPDPDLDRITLKGAWQMTNRSLQLFGKHAPVRPGPMPEPAYNPHLMIEAELLAVQRISPAPRRTPGIPWGLVSLTAGSALVSFIAFSLLTSLMMAIIITGVLVLHEGGHALLMRRFGQRDVHVFFVPLLGAFTMGRSPSPSVRSRILIFLAGPVPGLLIALAFLALSGSAPHGPWRNIIGSLLLINALNLLPFSPLDGGRVLEALSDPESPVRLLWQVVITVGLLLFVVKFNEPALLPLVLLTAIVIPYQYQMWLLRRAVARRCGRLRDRERVLRASLEELAIRRKYGLRSSIRQVRALAIADSFQAPLPSGSDRVFGVLAYLVSVAIGLTGMVLWVRL